MKTNEFLNVLKQYSDKNLLFEYRPGYFVASGYHLTEVKNIVIDSVDCGAGTDFWKETVVQLWEGPAEDTNHQMTAAKALGILTKVDQIKPMDKEAEVKFEYGNTEFHTAQLYVKAFEVADDELILKLRSEKTDCKAKEACGIPIASEVLTASSCTPESGCC